MDTEVEMIKLKTQNKQLKHQLYTLYTQLAEKLKEQNNNEKVSEYIKKANEVCPINIEINFNWIVTSHNSLNEYLQRIPNFAYYKTMNSVV